MPYDGGTNGHIATNELTAREREVLKLIAEGRSTKEIAHQLGISFKTAACHRSRILRKFNAHNSVLLVRAAIRAGLVEP
jgi:DNA-binding NarL/FixJ family response regulator